MSGLFAMAGGSPGALAQRGGASQEVVDMIDGKRREAEPPPAINGDDVTFRPIIDNGSPAPPPTPAPVASAAPSSPSRRADVKKLAAARQRSAAKPATIIGADDTLG